MLLFFLSSVVSVQGKIADPNPLLTAMSDMRATGIRFGQLTLAPRRFFEKRGSKWLIIEKTLAPGSREMFSGI